MRLRTSGQRNLPAPNQPIIALRFHSAVQLFVYNGRLTNSLPCSNSS